MQEPEPPFRNMGQQYRGFVPFYESFIFRRFLVILAFHDDPSPVIVLLPERIASNCIWPTAQVVHLNSSEERQPSLRRGAQFVGAVSATLSRTDEQAGPAVPKRDGQGNKGNNYRARSLQIRRYGPP